MEPRMDDPAAHGLLDGYRVLELGNFIAAPFAAKMFSDFGAEVIKIERPRTGDELRTWRLAKGRTSMLFRSMARNKKSLTLDLRTAQGRDIILRLAARSDVMIENFRPGTLEAWGLGPEELKAVNPDLVLVRISGYGQTGPYRQRAGFGSVAESFGGLRYLTGETDGPAVRSAASVGDAVAGLYGVVGALMVLLAKARPGGAAGASAAPESRAEPSPQDGAPNGVAVVDVALYEAVYSLLDSVVADYDAYGVVRPRMGGALQGVVPTGSYPCGDGAEVVIGANADGVFNRLLKAMERFDLADNPDLIGAEARARHEDMLNRAISEWTTSLSVDDVVNRLEAAGVPAAPVNDARGMAGDAHFDARGMHRSFAVEVEEGDLVDVRFPGVVPTIPANPGEIRDAGPDIGEHNTAVLHGLLGMDAEKIANLQEEGVI